MPINSLEERVFNSGPPEKVLSSVWPSTSAPRGLGPLAIQILGHQRWPKGPQSVEYYVLFLIIILVSIM